VHIPNDAELVARGASVDHLPSFSPPLRGGEAVVTGTLDWSETLPGWVGKWRTHWRDTDYAWGISGVNYDAAFRNIIRGVMLVASGAGPPDEGN
jgi:hypothetical protein